MLKNNTLNVETRRKWYGILIKVLINPLETSDYFDDDHTIICSSSPSHNIITRFSRNSEAFASEFQVNFENGFLYITCTAIYTARSNVQPQNS